MWDKDEFDADGAPPRCPMCGEYDCDCMRRLEFESEQKQGYIELKCIECGKEWLETDYYLDVYTGKDTYCEDCAPIIRVVCSECGREEEVICYEKSQEELFQSPKYRCESCIYKDINFEDFF